MTTNPHWNDLCQEYLQLCKTSSLRQAPRFQQPALRAMIRTISDGDVEWLRSSLGDEERKWFVAFVFDRIDLPTQLFEAMLRAAVREPNPSSNRAFVEPCVRAFGHRKVNRRLLDALRQGSAEEKAGAVNAMYWAQVPLVFTGAPPSWDLDHATPESREKYMAVADLVEEKRYLFLEEFVANPDVALRRCLLAGLDLSPEHYPQQLRPLVQQAIELARSHPDEYIRHRVEVQLGNERLLKPLPR